MLARSTPAAALGDTEHTPLFSQREKIHKEVKWVAEGKQGQKWCARHKSGKEEELSLFSCAVAFTAVAVLYCTTLDQIHTVVHKAKDNREA